MVNLTRAFRWLSIRNKLLIAFAGLSIFPVALVGVYDIVSNVRSTKEIAFSKLTRDVFSIKEKAANFLTNVESDLRVVRNSSSLQRYLIDTSLPNKGLEQAGAEILSFMKSKEIYYQIRLISDTGDELVRIEDTDPTRARRDYHIVATRYLRSGNAYYRLLTSNLKPDQIAFAPAELVGASNERVPVISFAMPIFFGTGRSGILIANVFAQDLFRVLESDQESVNGTVVLVSNDGYYLFHSQKKNAWNRLLATREEDNLHRDYPESVAKQIVSGGAGVLDSGDEIISYSPLFPRSAGDQGQQLVSGLAIPLYVFEGVPKSVILGPTYSLAWTFAGLLGVFLAGAIGLGLLATRQFTKPIAEMHRGAEIIANGNYDYRLKIETRDEIEQLAAQFNQMAVSLDAHEHEIQQHRTTLENTVHQRTRELVEEKAKLQAILDNVPSAFVLIDEQFRIQSASAAFTEITGKRPEDVRGLDCHAVFCSNGFCHECLCDLALSSGEAESHIDELIDGDGHQRFIEHAAIPMRENGERTSILEIITDITQRKRLEQNLVRTERLMAAGEMSAIIAHEFRNALTSIKMILQLQNESNRLSRTDKRSLGVALNSLYHMENVVTELLNFGRPSPLEFRLQNMATLIDESLSLVQIQLTTHNIRLEKTVDHSLPAMTVDASHLKEAIINILLNGTQAIRGKENRSTEETITVTAKIVNLRSTLRDVGFLPATGDQHPHPGVEDREILLLRGTDCVLVEISDTGTGIDKSTLGRIFDPFFTTKTNGTGLGLPMVKRTVNAHGGLVTVRSKKGKGATFSIYLPLQNGPVQ